MRVNVKLAWFDDAGAGRGTVYFGPKNQEVLVSGFDAVNIPALSKCAAREHILWNSQLKRRV